MRICVTSVEVCHDCCVCGIRERAPLECNCSHGSAHGNVCVTTGNVCVRERRDVSIGKVKITWYVHDKVILEPKKNELKVVYPRSDG